MFLAGLVIGAILAFVVLNLMVARERARADELESLVMAEMRIRAVKRAAISQMLQTVRQSRSDRGPAPGHDVVDYDDQE